MTSREKHIRIPHQPLIRAIGQRRILWLEEGNRYLIVDAHAYAVIRKLLDGRTTAQTSQWFARQYRLPPAQARRYVREVAQMLAKAARPDQTLHEPGPLATLPDQAVPDTVIRHYRINGERFRVAYPDEDLLPRTHALFAHLETGGDGTGGPAHHLEFRRIGHRVALLADGLMAGIWPPERFHELTGRFYLELLNRLYGMKEPDWLGVFHASAVHNGKETLMFAGESGRGKSTICAILMANGFTLSSDDLVPVDAKFGHPYTFPAGLSVKKQALPLLDPLHPHLAQSDEYHYPGQGKTVRYLPPTPANIDDARLFHHPCRAIIFVNYQPGSGCRLTRLPKYKAFQLLIPDSWISPLRPNVEQFLKWLTSTPCHQLTYDDNSLMINTIQTLFNNPSH